MFSQPHRSAIGQPHAMPGRWRKPYAAVGMMRALHSAIGLPNKSTSALWPLLLLMPEEVRRSLIYAFLGYVVALLDELISERETDPAMRP